MSGRRRDLVITILVNQVVGAISSRVDPVKIQPGATVKVTLPIDYDEEQLGPDFYDRVKAKLNDQWRPSRQVVSIRIVDETYLQLTFAG